MLHCYSDGTVISSENIGEQYYFGTAAIDNTGSVCIRWLRHTAGESYARIYSPVGLIGVQFIRQSSYIINHNTKPSVRSRNHRKCQKEGYACRIRRRHSAETGNLRFLLCKTSKTTIAVATEARCIEQHCRGLISVGKH